MNENQIKARTILESSIIRSAQCMSEMINTKVHIEDLNIVFHSAMHDSIRDSQETGSVLLKTEIVGPIGGINYAVFSKEEVKLLCGQVLDGDMEREQYQVFMIGFLKELENILAAAVISELANQLDEPIFGDVPKIEAIKGNGVTSVINREVAALVPDTVVSCEFRIPTVKIAPRIIWFFNESLAHGVHKIQAKEVA